MIPTLLHRTHFFVTVSSLSQLPGVGLADGDWRSGTPPEVAFVGRSNAGKSTAINLLCQQKRLAFSSKTPGRTQHLNFFEVADREQRYGFLVDLPGYGYAATDRHTQAHWGELITQYLEQRRALRGIVLVMDARRPLTDLDSQLLDWLAPTGVPVHALLTKADKLNRQAMLAALRQVREAFTGSPHSAQLFSALKRQGIDEATLLLLDWLGAAQKKNPDEAVTGV